MNQPSDDKKSFSISKLRNVILVCMVVGVAIYTGIMFSLAQRLSERFGPQVRADLEWRVQRGAQELSRAAELGLTIGDSALVTKAFGVYALSNDVQAIVAQDATGKVLAQHGKPPKDDLFSGRPGVVRTGPTYLVSWAETQIEGMPVGRVAVVVTTQRLQEAQQLLERSSNTTLTGGLGALLLGTVIVCFFTGAVALRDAQLSDYAKNLERKVDERTRQLDERNAGMRLVLDNVAQGFVTIDLQGNMASERSAIVDRWFGAPASNSTLSAYLKPHAARFVEQLDMGLAELRDGIMPTELLLYQLPTRFSAAGRTFETSYTGIGDLETPDRLLVIISDVTEAVARERADSEQKELVTLFRRINSDRAGVEEFLMEAAQLVSTLRLEEDPVVQQRLVHTLKGNCSMYGLESYAQLAHQIENELIEGSGPLSPSQRATLVDEWKRTIGRVGFLLSDSRRNTIQLDASELDALMTSAMCGAAANDVVATLQDWKREPIYRRLERLARQASAVAERLNKPKPKFEIDAQGIRLDGDSLAPFWAAMIHVVRNALDHGIEDPETRALLGKPEAGTIALSARRQDGKLVISVRDDGSGVNWERVRAKAAARSLPNRTREDLVDALFSDGLSTKDEATDISGRGVGLAALKQIVRELGGTIEVDSSPQWGTAFHFVLDERSNSNAPASVRRVSASLLPDLS